MYFHPEIFQRWAQVPCPCHPLHPTSHTDPNPICSSPCTRFWSQDLWDRSPHLSCPVSEGPGCANAHMLHPEWQEVWAQELRGREALEHSSMPEPGKQLAMPPPSNSWLVPNLALGARTALSCADWVSLFAIVPGIELPCTVARELSSFGSFWWRTVYRPWRSWALGTSLLLSLEDIRCSPCSLKSVHSAPLHSELPSCLDPTELVRSALSKVSVPLPGRHPCLHRDISPLPIYPQPTYLLMYCIYPSTHSPRLHLAIYIFKSLVGWSTIKSLSIL